MKIYYFRFYGKLSLPTFNFNVNLILAGACIGFSAVGVTEDKHGFNNLAWFFWALFTITIIVCSLCIKMQPESSAPLDFKVLFKYIENKKINSSIAKPENEFKI